MEMKYLFGSGTVFFNGFSVSLSVFFFWGGGRFFPPFPDPHPRSKSWLCYSPCFFFYCFSFEGILVGREKARGLCLNRIKWSEINDISAAFGVHKLGFSRLRVHLFAYKFLLLKVGQSAFIVP